MSLTRPWRHGLSRYAVAALVTSLGVGLAGGSVANSSITSTTSFVKLRAVLTPAQETAPPGLTKPGERGVFTATFNRANARLTWRLTYTRLSGPAVGGHIHKGKRGQDGDVLVDLCGTSTYSSTRRPCKNGVHAIYGEKDGVYSFTLGDILAGSYAQIHTRANRLGELRGQVRIVK